MNFAYGARGVAIAYLKSMQLANTTLILLLMLNLMACSGGLSSSTNPNSGQGGNSNSEGGTPNCESSTFEIQIPAEVYLGQNATFISNRENTFWKIILPGGGQVDQAAIRLNYSFLSTGEYLGSASFLNDCNVEETKNFSVLVKAVPAVSVLINNGEAYTNSSTVNLSFAGNDLTQLLVSGDSNCATGTWQSFVSSKTVPLAGANVTNTLYAKFMFSNGFESACVSDSILYDSIFPVAEITSAPPLTGTGTSASFSLSGFDTLSGVNQLYCELNGVGFSSCVSPKVYTVAVGQHTFRVFARDRAGNTSIIKSFTWQVTVPPVVVPDPPQVPDPIPDPPQNPNPMPDPSNYCPSLVTHPAMNPIGFQRINQTWVQAFSSRTGNPRATYPNSVGYPVPIGGNKGTYTVTPFVPTANLDVTMTWDQVQSNAQMGYPRPRPAETMFFSISPCPGDLRAYQPAGTDPWLNESCRRVGGGGSISYSTKPGGNPAYVCKLEAGRTYYLNVSPVDPADGITPGEHTCSNTAANSAAGCEVQMRHTGSN